MSHSKAKGHAETLRLAVKNATHVTYQRESTLKMIMGARGPLMTFEWYTSVLRIFGAKRVNDYLQLLRSSIIHLKDYVAPANLVKRAMKEVVSLIHPHWCPGASCIRKFRDRPQFNWGDVIDTVNFLRTHDVDTPWGLARAP